MEIDILYSQEMITHLHSMDREKRELAINLMENPFSGDSVCVLPLLPTLREGHFDNVKLEWVTMEGRESREFRFLLSRMTTKDGAKCDYEVTLERRFKNRREEGWKVFSHGPAVKHKRKD